MEQKLTIFSAPKPFVDPHIIDIQMNAIRSWKALGEEVAIVLIGDETGIRQAANETGSIFVEDVKRNRLGTPLISSIFNIGRGQNNSPLLAYINTDILLFDDFLTSALTILSQSSKFLVVGQRYDLDIQSQIDFNGNWTKKIKETSNQTGKLHSRGGSDYFIYPRDTFIDIPDFAVGRAGWDNWMFYQARRNKWKVIDATPSIFIIHQNHDYSHLPGGQSHYRLPETADNVKLAGGNRTIFSLLDVNYEFRAGVISRFPLSWKKMIREIEIFPLTTLKSMLIAQIFYCIFHPLKAYAELRKWLKQNKGSENV
jgi:hypothetical protein